MLSGGPRACAEGEEPGTPCEDASCSGTHCGIRFDLECEDGAWSLRYSTGAWELVCPPGNESAESLVQIASGACCEELRPRSDVYTEPPSCELCPSSAPEQGAPCSLPDDCTPRIIDCFYKCCCYGDTTWAQCDGKRWRVATNCSSK